MKINLNKIRFFIYIAILVLSIVFASYHGGPVSYLWLYAILLLIPLSVFYLIFNYRTLRIYQELDAIKITKGEVHNYRAVFENNGCFPIHKMGLYTYTDRCKLSEIEEKKELNLRSFDRQELLSEITCNYAGGYYIGIEKISLEDPFGLFQVIIPIPWSFRAIVRPQVTDKAAGALEIENLINSTGLKSEDHFEEIPGSDTRIYQPGDPMHAINWKVSAKTSKLMVRMPEKMERRTLTLFLLADSAPEDSQDIAFLKRRDYFLEFVISTAWLFSEQGLPLRVLYPSGKLTETTITSYQSFMDFYNNVTDHIYYGSSKVLEEMQKMSEERRSNAFENDTWIIIKETPVNGEEFYTVCD